MSDVQQRWPLVLAAVVTIATIIGYATLIRGQQVTSLSDPVSIVVIGYLTCLVAAAGVGVASPGRFASVGASAATGGLVGMGVLGIFSIGLPLLVAAAFAAWGTARTRRTSTHSAWLDASVGLVAAAVAPALFLLT